MKAAIHFFRRRIIAGLLAMVPMLAGAEDFGDISVSAQAMYTGNTCHGYGETRVTLQNHSAGKTHVVTLGCPNRSWNSGNTIDQVTRTVTLPPSTRVVVALLQPPLPANGDGMIRVGIDGGGGEPNLIRLPNANNHINASRSYGGSGLTTVAFISRNLDYDDVARVFNSERGQFSAAMATDAPDSSGSTGYIPTAWMPDTRHYGATNWLELDYATPMKAERLLIYHTQPLPSGGTIILSGSSGTNLTRLTMSGGTAISRGRDETEFTFPATAQPVKTVRLEFGKAPPASIAIDAVQLIGSSGNAWAADARASSDNSAAAATRSYGGSGSDATESLRAEAPVSEWSDNWLAYTPFDVIALNSLDVNSAPPAVAAALWSYLQAGGNVIIFGNDALPATWRSSNQTVLPDGVEYRVGLGSCFVIPKVSLSQLDPKTLQTLRDTANGAARYWQSLPGDAGSANGVFPVVANLKIPVRGIVIIMLAFIIIIGPVNIILLNRRNRRTWMLWTIPAISLVTTLIVFAYSLLREGITPDTRIGGLTVLDQINHHAATMGVTAFYCPLTPSGGLRFNNETEASPLVHVGYENSGSPREVDWTQTQHFQRGWISARVPAHFHLRKSESRRERIQIVHENGKLSVVNGLGAPIKSLWFADAALNFYEANNIPAGQKAGLILSKPAQPPAKSGAEGLFHDLGFTANPELLKDGSGKYLLPDTYIAVLDGNPFIENALGSSSSPKRTKQSSVVFGILDPTEAK
ncbi:MAG TPA: hypothetical protein VNN22_21925 [Verrucomicrobiae bacterium]|nr:hypothetical protein [Verrucomicrobiae bacterium]